MSAPDVILRFDAVLVRRLQLATSLTVAILILASLLAHVAHFGLGVRDQGAFGFIYYMVNLDNERNLPTWTSIILLALSALLLFLTAAADGPRWRWYWCALGCAFLFLSLDESVGLHERLTEPLRHRFELSVIFTNAWVMVAVPLAALFALAFVPFLIALPARTRTAFIIAGVLYVGGAAGVELVSGVMKVKYGIEDVRFAVSSWLEESLELVGIALFLRAAADQLIGLAKVPGPAGAEPGASG